MPENPIQFGRIRLDPKRVAARILARRESLGLSLRELAERSGVASSTIHNLEQGSYRLQLDKFLAILGALDLVPEEVLEIGGQVNTPPPTEFEAKIAKLLREGNHAAMLRLLADQLDVESEES